MHITDKSDNMYESEHYNVYCWPRVLPREEATSAPALKRLLEESRAGCWPRSEGAALATSQRVEKQKPARRSAKVLEAGSLDALRPRTVRAPAVRGRHQQLTDEFDELLAEQGLQLRPRFSARGSAALPLTECDAAALDLSLAEWMLGQCLEGVDHWRGVQMLAALRWGDPRLARDGSARLPAARQSLRGWKVLAPPQTRSPLPEELAGSSARGAGRLGKARKASLFTLTADDVALLFRGAARRLGLPGVMPHLPCHSGASGDFANQLRPLSEVMRRGRWKTDASVRHCEKGGRLAEQFSKLPPDLQGHALRPRGQASASRAGRVSGRVVLACIRSAARVRAGGGSQYGLGLGFRCLSVEYLALPATPQAAAIAFGRAVWFEDLAAGERAGKTIKNLGGVLGEWPVSSFSRVGWHEHRREHAPAPGGAAAPEKATVVEVVEGDEGPAVKVPSKKDVVIEGTDEDDEDDDEDSGDEKGEDGEAQHDKTIIVEHQAAPPEGGGGDAALRRMEERMRAALQALRERRADLEAVNAELAAEREKNEALAEQLQAERDTNALLDVRSAALQAQLNEAQAELERAQGNGSGAGAEQELALARQKNVELRMQISEEVGVARGERDKARKELAELKRLVLTDARDRQQASFRGTGVSTI
ncbi:unnamed protein product [Prorocentrum cordatum]|uniref:Uncharacterized protein n=1 Tax=Prorocentrum cordatum TaxID=2364126 RepID=A0ABN9TX33_9DINO|nr:unnamed protein product [Polarella glacialis]